MIDYRTKPFLLDGATGTNLYLAGMPHGVCVEQWVLDNPTAIINLQRAFVEAGSDAVLAPTFSANRAKLAHYGLADKVREMNMRLVALSKEAVNGKAAVGGDMSPSGLFLRPFGDCTFDKLIELYAEQASALYEGGADFYMIETQMSLSETRTAVLAIQSVCDLPIFVTMTVDKRGRTLAGNSLLSCLTVLSGIGVSAFGLNCSTGPENMLPMLSELAPYANIPLIAKPNAGVANDAGIIEYLPPEVFADAVPGLMDAGVHILGGCCGTTPEHIHQIKARISENRPVPTCKKESGIVAATEKNIFFLEGEPDLSAPVSCNEDLAESLMELESTPCDAVLIEINDLQDIKVTADNSYLLNLPLCVSIQDTALLETMAKEYHGTLLIDSRAISDRTTAEAIAKRYGSIII